MKILKYLLIFVFLVFISFLVVSNVSAEVYVDAGKETIYIDGTENTITDIWNDADVDDSMLWNVSIGNRWSWLANYTINVNDTSTLFLGPNFDCHWLKLKNSSAVLRVYGNLSANNTVISAWNAIGSTGSNDTEIGNDFRSYIYAVPYAYTEFNNCSLGNLGYNTSTTSFNGITLHNRTYLQNVYINNNYWGLNLVDMNTFDCKNVTVEVDLVGNGTSNIYDTMTKGFIVQNGSDANGSIHLNFTSCVANDTGVGFTVTGGRCSFNLCEVNMTTAGTGKAMYLVQQITNFVDGTNITNSAFTYNDVGIYIRHDGVAYPNTINVTNCRFIATSETGEHGIFLYNVNHMSINDSYFKRWNSSITLAGWNTHNITIGNCTFVNSSASTTVYDGSLGLTLHSNSYDNSSSVLSANTSVNLTIRSHYPVKGENMTVGTGLMTLYHDNGSGAVDYEYVPLIANISTGNCHINVTDWDNLTWTASGTSGTLYQQVGGLSAGSRYDLYTDGVLIHEKVVANSTGYVWFNHSSWSEHTFLVSLYTVPPPNVDASGGSEVVVDDNEDDFVMSDDITDDAVVLAEGEGDNLFDDISNTINSVPMELFLLILLMIPFFWFGIKRKSGQFTLVGTAILITLLAGIYTEGLPLSWRNAEWVITSMQYLFVDVIIFILILYFFSKHTRVGRRLFKIR